MAPSGWSRRLDDSTGSVGDSSAPSRKHSSQPRSVSACVTTATSTQVIGIARASLRSGSRHVDCSISPSTSSPSRNRITISATTASCCTNGDPASKCRTPRLSSPSRKPATTKTRGEREERPLREAGQQGPGHQQRAEDEHCVVEAAALDSGGHTRSRHRDRVPRGGPGRRAGRESGAVCVQVTVLGKSPSWQDAGGACSGYLVQEDGTTLLLDCGNGVFSQAAPAHGLPRRRRRRHLAPARGPFPRPDPVQLRADLRAAPAARARPHLAGDGLAGQAGAARAARRPRRLPPRGRARGATRTSSRTRSTCASTTRMARSRSARWASASTPSRTSCRPTPSRSRRRSTAAAASPTAPTARRRRTSSSSRAKPTCC